MDNNLESGNALNKSDDTKSPESTASTKAERASSLSATQYSELFYYAPISYCTVNQNAIILSSNQAPDFYWVIPIRN